MARNGYGPFRESIDEYQNTVIAVTVLWKLFEIHTQMLHRIVGYG